MLKQHLIAINFLDEWIYVNPSTIRIENFTFPNIPDIHFAACLIEDKNGNKGIALLSGKIVKQINDGSLWSNNPSNILTFRMIKHDIAKFPPKTEIIFKNYAENISKHRASFLKSICSDSGVCIAFGKQIKRISKHFKGFVNFEYAQSPVKNIGVGGNAFIKSITYERDGYTANAILKSATRPYSDNLLFEYIVGQYINKQCLLFPCFIETYGWYKYITHADWLYMKDNIEVTSEKLKHSLQIGEVALKNYIKSANSSQKICYEDKTKPKTERKIKDCTELDYLLKVACEKSNYLSILIQSINNTKDMQTMITLSSSDLDFNLDLLNVLYQIYMPLASLSETFTHYDLHSRNVLIYEPVLGKYIEYRYVLDDKSIVEFKCRYIAKIIDYGHAFFRDDSNTGILGSSKSIYETICKNIPECTTNTDITRNCGQDKGFSTFGNENFYYSGYSIDSCVRNRSHDLLLLYQIKKELKRHSSSKTNPLLQNIFDNLEYGNEKLLETEELETGSSSYELGSIEKLTDDNFPERINNVIDAHNALKRAVLEYKTQNDLDHEGLTSFGSLTIYQSGRPMKFIQK
jgi:hypothetical protein